ncbi:MAG: hypothetical protein LBH12_01400 [Dysgonamonadaceae bacterium]|jgi:hypothetical protein|nr:hypothetical protein [Dysgonamonadaceae bacterium]
MCTISKETVLKANNATRASSVADMAVADTFGEAIRVSVNHMGHTYSQTITKSQIRSAYAKSLDSK